MRNVDRLPRIKSRPFPHVVVKNFLDPPTLDLVIDALAGLEYDFKESDLFSYWASIELTDINQVGWRTIGVSGSRIQAIAEIMADVILEEQDNIGFELDMVAGVTNNGVPLATVVSDLLGIDFGMIRPSREGTQINYASNYAGLKGKNVVLIDDVVSSGSTAEEVIEFVRAREGVPVLAMVLINKKADNKIDDVPLRALIRARPVRT